MNQNPNMDLIARLVGEGSFYTQGIVGVNTRERLDFFMVQIPGEPASVSARITSRGREGPDRQFYVNSVIIEPAMYGFPRTIHVLFYLRNIADFELSFVLGAGDTIVGSIIIRGAADHVNQTKPFTACRINPADLAVPLAVPQVVAPAVPVVPQ